MNSFLECGSFILQDVRWHLNGVIKLYINFNLLRIIDQHPLQETIFINNFLIELNTLKNEKKTKKDK